MRHLGKCGNGACECWRWSLDARLAAAGFPRPVIYVAAEDEETAHEAAEQGHDMVYILDGIAYPLPLEVYGRIPHEVTVARWERIDLSAVCPWPGRPVRPAPTLRLRVYRFAQRDVYGHDRTQPT